MTEFGSSSEVLSAVWSFLYSTGLSNYLGAGFIMVIAIGAIGLMFGRR